MFSEDKMGKTILLSIIIINLFFIANSNLWGYGLYNNGCPQQTELDNEQPYVPGQIIIKFKYDEIIALLSLCPIKNAIMYPPEILLMHKYAADIKTVKSFPIKGYWLVETTDNCYIQLLQEQLLNDPLVGTASLNYIASIAVTPPNDPDFIYQYALYNYGQIFKPEGNMQGTSGSDIKALGGWDWSTGGAEIIIAIIDSGVTADHEDLVNQVVPGYNFVYDNNNTYDDNGHGTFVASIAAAETNNGKGMAGVSWHSKIMPIKVVSSAGQGTYTNIALGIRYAADQGARVLNLSLGGSTPSFILEDACRYAFDKGCVIAVASGNSGGRVLYPAAYDSDCLAVAATDANDIRASFSNIGPELDIAAPGVFVFGALFSPNEPDILNNYGWGSGTSFSTPYVAGAAALLLHYKPFLTNIQVMKLLRFTADDVNKSLYPGVDNYLGYGRINLATLLGPYSFE